VERNRFPLSRPVEFPKFQPWTGRTGGGPESSWGNTSSNPLSGSITPLQDLQSTGREPASNTNLETRDLPSPGFRLGKSSRLAATAYEKQRKPPRESGLGGGSGRAEGDLPPHVWGNRGPRGRGAPHDLNQGCGGSKANSTNSPSGK